MRWARAAMDATGVRRVDSRLTERRRRTAKACGPGAATLAPRGRKSLPPATGARQAVPRGERAISRKAIARGKPGCLGCTCGSTRVHFVARLPHAGLRVQPAPGFPCASSKERAMRTDGQPGRCRAAGIRTHVDGQRRRLMTCPSAANLLSGDDEAAVIMSSRQGCARRP